MVTKSIQECLGWYEDWPDGSSSYKVWFDRDGNKVGASIPDVQYLMEWLVAAGALVHVSWQNDKWNVLYLDKERHAFQVSAHRLDRVLAWAVRGHVGET